MSVVQQQQGRPPACRAISQHAGGSGRLQEKEKIKSREAGARKEPELKKITAVVIRLCSSALVNETKERVV